MFPSLYILYVLNLNGQYPTASAGLSFCQQLLLTKQWWQHPVSHIFKDC